MLSYQVLTKESSMMLGEIDEKCIQRKGRDQVDAFSLPNPVYTCFGNHTKSQILSLQITINTIYKTLISYNH